MKKHLLLSVVAILALFLSSRSQVVNKGDRLFGGSFVFAIYNSNSLPNFPTQSNVALMPSFAWAVKRNMTMGIKGSIGYGRSSYETSVQKVTNTSLQVGPGIFLRKYRDLKDRFGIYFNHGIDFLYSYGKQKNSNLGITEKNETWTSRYTFTPGVFYKFSQHFIGEASIGDAYFTYIGGISTNTYFIGASFLQSFNLGINYIIPRRG